MTTLEIRPELKKFMQELLDKLLFNPVTRRRVLVEAANALKQMATQYPPEGIWNRPPGTRGDNRWYERGYGGRWFRRDGSLGGSNTSQQLDRSWKTEIQKRDLFSASAFTEVTYAPFLLDPNQRVEWAKGHGWQTIDDIEKDFAPIFEEIVLDEIDKY